MTQALRPVGGPTQIEENVRQVTRMLMKRDGVTLPALALRLGVSRTAVSNRLGGPVPYSGKKPFTINELAVLGELFDAPPSVFLAGPDAIISGHTGSGSIKNLRRPASRSEVSHRTGGTRLLAVVAA